MTLRQAPTPVLVMSQAESESVSTKMASIPPVGLNRKKRAHPPVSFPLVKGTFKSATAWIVLVGSVFFTFVFSGLDLIDFSGWFFGGAIMM
ncbi:MAG: hypothetical protein HOH58_11850 [Opitutaceae bacterium]|nr:hypothetical protein [Opitutaceae bacterium]